MDFFYRFRQWLSGPPAIIIAIIVITTPITRVVERMVPKDLFEMPVTLSDPPPPPPPPKQVQVQPQEVQPVVAPQVQDVITKESVVIEVKPAPPPTAPVEQPRVEPPPVVTGTGPSIGQIQAGYERTISAYVQSIKRYPTSREARMQRPTGKVGLWIEVNRDGSLKDAGIAKSSDFILLDNAALATVRQGKFPPFPVDTYPGESVHRFTFTLDYNLEQPN